MSARLVGAGAFVAGAVLGAGGLWLALPSAPPPGAPPRDERARPAGPCAPAGPAIDIAEIRAVVRQEVLAAVAALPACAAAPVSSPAVMAAVAPPAPPPAPPEEPPEGTHPESSHPKSSGHESADVQRLMENSLSRRVWSAEDRAQMQSLLPRLSPTERERVMRQVIVAVNRGELKAEVVGPLF